MVRVDPITAAIRASKDQVLRDLQVRLIKARGALEQLRESDRRDGSRTPRLSGKVEGVNLAISYVEEALRKVRSDG